MKNTRFAAVVKIFVFLTILFCLVSCSSAPSSAVLEKLVSDQVMADPIDAQLFEFKNFSKIDGVKKDDHTYIAMVQYDLVFKVNIAQATKIVNQTILDTPQGNALKDDKDNPFGKLASTLMAGSMYSALVQNYGEFKAGDAIHKKLKVTLLKSEKGWILDDSEES